MPRQPASPGPSRRRIAAAGSAALVATALTTGCSSASSDAAGDDRLTVVASTNVYADIARQVAGDDAEVTAFVSSPSQDPHSYVASARDIVTVSHADVVIENGGGYDDFVDQLLESAPGDPIVLNAVDVSAVTAPAGEELNEHVWYNVAAIRAVALALRDSFAAADPGHAADYRHNAAAYAARLTGLVRDERRLRQDVAGTPVAVTEPLPGYLIDALGLVDKTPDGFSEAIESGDEVSVATLHAMLDLLDQRQVDLLFVNDQTEGPIITQLTDAAESSAVPVIHLTETLPDRVSYLQLVETTLDEVAHALGAQR